MVTKPPSDGCLGVTENVHWLRSIKVGVRVAVRETTAGVTTTGTGATAAVVDVARNGGLVGNNGGAVGKTMVAVGRGVCVARGA